MNGFCRYLIFSSSYLSCRMMKYFAVRFTGGTKRFLLQITETRSLDHALPASAFGAYPVKTFPGNVGLNPVNAACHLRSRLVMRMVSWDYPARKISKESGGDRQRWRKEKQTQIQTQVLLFLVQSRSVLNRWRASTSCAFSRRDEVSSASTWRATSRQTSKPATRWQRINDQIRSKSDQTSGETASQ